MRGRVGSEAAPNYERGRTIPGPTNPTISLPPPSSSGTSVPWLFCALPHDWGPFCPRVPGGVGTYSGSRGAAPGRGRGTDGPRGVRGKAPRGLLQVGQQAAAQLPERGDSRLYGVEWCGALMLGDGHQDRAHIGALVAERVGR